MITLPLGARGPRGSLLAELSDLGIPADRLDEVEEHPDLGWRLSPRRIEGVKGK